MENNHTSSHAAIGLGVLTLLERSIGKYLTDGTLMSLVADDVAVLSGIASIAWIIYQYIQARKANKK
jgi:hypothetical protein